MKSAVLGLVLGALAGCAVFHPAAEQAVTVDAIVGEALNAARAPAAEQRAALSRAQQGFLQDGAVTNRLRLATLLAILPPPLRDDGRAAELLEPIRDANTPGVSRFAALLSAQLAERQRLVRELERLARDRDRADKERDKREEGLRQQLEALRAIERGILERDDRLRKRQR